MRDQAYEVFKKEYEPMFPGDWVLGDFTFAHDPEEQIRLMRECVALKKPWEWLFEKKYQKPGAVY